MDEILASIRRIIESGDEGEGGSTVLSIPPELDEPSTNHVPESARGPEAPESAGLVPVIPPFDIHYHPVPPADDTLVGRHLPPNVPTVEESAPADVAETTTAADEAEPAVDDDAEEAERPAAAADVSDDAWWDAAVADANDVEADIEPATGGAPEVLGHPAPVNENDVVEDRPEPERAENAESGSAGAVSRHPVSPEFATREAIAPAKAPATSASATATAPVEQPAMPESVLAGASALLSAQAGDQVAAAFEDLTRAIREGQMRSMEGMAREIMRPMLQEWLDDNLPRIVERLVREEIERIARGPHR